MLKAFFLWEKNWTSIPNRPDVTLSGDVLVCDQSPSTSRLGLTPLCIVTMVTKLVGNSEKGANAQNALATCTELP